MDTNLSEHEALLQSELRKVLVRELPTESIAAAGESDDFPRGTWQALSEGGWFRVALDAPRPQQRWIDFAIVLEQLGWFACPGPVIEQTVVASQSFATDAEQGAIAAGTCITTIARIDKPMEPVVVENLKAETGAVLRGAKVLVPYGGVAEFLVVLTGHPGAQECYFVNASSLTFAPRPERSLSRTGACEVQFDSTPATKKADANELLRLYELGANSYSVGLMGRILEMTSSYVSNRTQFGRPIGTLQAVQHRVADMALAYYGAQSLLYNSAWSMASGELAERSRLHARAFIRDAIGEVVRHAHQLHGAMGFTIEYPLHLYTRRAAVLQHTFGSSHDAYRDLANFDSDSEDDYWTHRLGNRRRRLVPKY